MWHVLEHREMKRVARGRDAARHGSRPRAPLDALDLTGVPAFLEPPVLPEPGLGWGAWQAGGSA